MFYEKCNTKKVSTGTPHCRIFMSWYGYISTCLPPTLEILGADWKELLQTFLLIFDCVLAREPKFYSQIVIRITWYKTVRIKIQSYSFGLQNWNVIASTNNPFIFETLKSKSYSSKSIKMFGNGKIAVLKTWPLLPAFSFQFNTKLVKCITKNYIHRQRHREKYEATENRR